MTAGLPPAEILPASHVSELIQSLVKALRAFQMYLPNNPIYQRAIGLFSSLITGHFLCARRGSNAQPTASEAVTLSS